MLCESGFEVSGFATTAISSVGGRPRPADREVVREETRRLTAIARSEHVGVVSIGGCAGRRSGEGAKGAAGVLARSIERLRECAESANAWADFESRIMREIAAWRLHLKCAQLLNFQLR
jgi:hypothetical protein